MEQKKYINLQFHNFVEEAQPSNCKFLDWNSFASGITKLKFSYTIGPPKCVFTFKMDYYSEKKNSGKLYNMGCEKLSFLVYFM
jgi:hypothetical protein